MDEVLPILFITKTSTGYIVKTTNGHGATETITDPETVRDIFELWISGSLPAPYPKQ